MAKVFLANELQLFMLMKLPTYSAVNVVKRKSEKIVPDTWEKDTVLGGCMSIGG